MSASLIWLQDDDYDLVSDEHDALAIELSRSDGGVWRFWAIRLPNGARFGREHLVHGEAALWLEMEWRAIGGRGGEAA